MITLYRPITLALTLSKVLEHILNRRLLTFTLQNNLLQEYQTAFLPGKSTCDNILHATQIIIDNFIIGNYILAISLDIQQAFDRTWHSAILHTLQPHVPAKFLQIIHSFLTDRQITLKFDNTIHNTSICQTQGVPQGSPISPLLFNILMATAPAINNKHIQTHNYADDTFYISSANTPQLTWTQLQPHINNFINWCNKYRLKIQAHKTTNTFFTRRKTTPSSAYPQITIQNTHIERQKNITILGATLDIHMTLKQHIKRITNNSLHTINKIRKIFTTHRQIPPYIGILLYKTLLRTKFTYAAPLLTLIKPTTWRTLQHIEHRALRAAQRKGIRTRITRLYGLSKIQPIQDHYNKISKDTLLRIINTKNKRLLKTILSTQHKKQLVYTSPPLDQALHLFDSNTQQNLRTHIKKLFDPP